MLVDNLARVPRKSKHCPPLRTPLPLFEEAPHPPAWPRPPRLELTESQARMFAVLVRTCKPRGSCRRSARELGQEAGISQSAATKVRRELAALGLIFVWVDAPGSTPVVSLLNWPAVRGITPMSLADHARRIGGNLATLLWEAGQLARCLVEAGEADQAEQIAGIAAGLRRAGSDLLPMRPMKAGDIRGE